MRTRSESGSVRCSWRLRKSVFRGELAANFPSWARRGFDRMRDDRPGQEDRWDEKASLLSGVP